MDDASAPTLFGLVHTNRNFSTKNDWGKNVFNNAFPASILCYFQYKGIKPVYLKIEDGLVVRDYIDAKAVLGDDYKNLYFMFESFYPPYEDFVTGHIPRTDLVTFHRNESDLPSEAVQDIEIKLTAVPDHVTSELEPALQGPEIVVRPDTVVYLAMSIITKYISKRDALLTITKPISDKVNNWNSKSEIEPLLEDMILGLETIMNSHADAQQPILIQPIWRTVGKSLELTEDAFDIFVWSDFAFAKLFIDQAKRNGVSSARLTRFQRSVVWLFKMLHDYAESGVVDHSSVIRNINFGSQTDKAFAANGRITNSYLISDELMKPRIKKNELSKIILNGGHEMLSPERRFDASVLSNISLFDN
jgi:hypothetical protein